MLRRVQANQPLYSLEAELVPQPLAAARRLGSSGQLAAQARAREPEPAPGVVHRAPGRRLAGGRQLKQGDILLAIDDKVVTQFREVELAVADKPRSERHGVARRRRAARARWPPRR